jgi:putative ABC transport system permease protein
MLLTEGMLVALPGTCRYCAGTPLQQAHLFGTEQHMDGYCADGDAGHAHTGCHTPDRFAIHGHCLARTLSSAEKIPADDPRQKRKSQSTAASKKVKNCSDGSHSYRRSLALIILQSVRGEAVNAGLFFAAGGLLLVSGLLFSYSTLTSAQSAGLFVKGITSLGLKNTMRNATRSITIIILFSIGTFLVISTGSNRKDLFVNAEDTSSGTGGFLYYAESTIPVLQNLANNEVRYNYGLSEGYDVVQMRVADGDDASCLNLNRIENPRILGVKPEKLSGRFSFVTATPELKEDDPWATLDVALEGDLIPAIADETVIKWGLGMKVGDTLHYEDADGNIMNLLLIGGLAPSIFQGSVIISENLFLERFPGSSGTEVFLVDGNLQDTC